ncbi:hypothetical protein F5888DRAFT_1713392 [Russula emetica]|nr:hypothetical protein F5888DRAFT_1713392 [Russula emetica]
MSTTFLTLFVAMAYAAPVAPKGAILNRQACSMDCRDAVSVGGVSLQESSCLTEFCRPPRRRVQVQLILLR